MNYFAQQDSQGSRLLFIMSSFRDVVVRQQVARSQHLSANQTPQNFMASLAPTLSDDTDPMGNLFSPSGPFSPTATTGPPKVDPSASRHTSDPKITSPSTPHASLRRTSSHPNGAFAGANGEFMGQRNNSVDGFLDLSRVSSHPNSLDGNDSLGDAEIDFEAFWSWGNQGGNGFTSGGMGSASMFGGQAGLSGMGDLQGMNDGSVSLFGLNQSDFGGGS